MSSSPNSSPVPRHVLETVYRENLDAFQIGGKTDGIDPKVASDIGYTISLDEVHDIADQAEASRPYSGDAYEGDARPAAHELGVGDILSESESLAGKIGILGFDKEAARRRYQEADLFMRQRGKAIRQARRKSGQH